MDNEENNKQATKSTIPYVQLEQVNSDYAFALALQEQERTVAPFTMSESESEEDDANEDESDYDYNDNADVFFEAAVAELEDEDFNYDEDTDEEDDIDPDELSYEELIALGEIVGTENKGLSKDELSSCLHPFPYTNSQSSDLCKYGFHQCVICQIEYEEGEPVVALPCKHPYHSECISKWLHINKVCPICNMEVSSSASQ